MRAFLIILFIVIVLVISYFIANSYYEIALEKGYDNRKYFWIAFWFGIAGWLLVVALPDKRVQAAGSAADATAPDFNHLPKL